MMSKRKKLLSILVVAVLLIASMVPAFAEAPKFWDLKTGKEYNTASEVVAAIRVGEVVGENIYEKIGDEGYVNVVERFNTKIEALRQFLNEKSIGSPEELLEDTELFESFINVGKEAAETVPAKSKEEIAA